jgi:hypothetical protein
MNANALRSILLVKSVEDHDPDGSVLSLAERDAATRDALRRHPAVEGDPSGQAWQVLAERAVVLQARLAERHPVVTRTLELESRLAVSGWLLLLVALVGGAALSLLDSRVRIEILAFPLLGVVLWNLVVYGVLLYSAFRTGDSRVGSAVAQLPAWTLWPARWGWQRATRLIKQSTFYHRPLAAALRKFSADWWPLAQPMLSQQGQRVFHLGSVAVALGLIAGFYLRGIALEYRAGWESTFLGPEQVRTVLGWIYGPASVATGIELPRDAVATESLHWRDGQGGGSAAPWIHLMAATAILYVVVPRLLLALWSTVRLAGLRARFVPPDSLATYARAVLGGSNAALPAQSVRLTAFAYQPGSSSEQGVQRLLRAAFGMDTRIDFAPVLHYGCEAEQDTPSREHSSDIDVLLFNLAATPEAENHGSVLQQARTRQERAAAGSRLLVLVDESPYVARLGGDASLAGRIEQRRAAWKDFVRAHGLEACCVDLAAVPLEGELARDVVERVQRGCRTRAA